MVREIKEGIGDTGVKAGHVKIAITDLSLRQERALRGAARAAKETGLSLTVHPGFGIGSDGRRIVEILLAEGLPAPRIVIAHADGFLVELNLQRLVLDPSSWGLRLDYHRALLARGVNLSIDCFGHMWSPEREGELIEHDWQRLAGVVALVREGYSPQLVLGTDTFLKILTRRGGGRGYARLPRYVLPTLRALGVSDFDIRQMTEVNPARILVLR
jgi:phosphotriesterase-related protein